LIRSSPALASWTISLAAVLLLWQLTEGWIATCGTTNAASTTFCFAVVIAAAIANWLSRRYPSSRAETGMAIVGISLASWICPGLIDEAVVQSIRLGAPPAVIWLAAGLPVMMMVTCAALLLFRNTHTAPRRFLFVVALATMLFLSHVGMPQSYSVTVLVLATLSVLFRYPGTKNPPVAASEKPFEPRLFVSSVAGGMTLAAVWMIFSRLFPVTLMTAASGMACISVLLLVSSFGPLRFRQHPRWVFALALLALSGSSWFYSELLNWNLTFNATTDAGWKIIFAQGMQLAGWSVPVLLTLLAVSQTLRPSTVPTFSIIGTLCGIGLACMFASSPVHPASVVVGGLAVLIGPMLFALVPSFVHSRLDGFGRVGLYVSAAVALAGLAINPPDLAQPPRLLFTGQARDAVYLGIDPAMIPFTDASRLIRSDETIGSTTTFWKYWGDATDCRVNGLSIGVESTNTDVTPQSPTELLTAIIPLSVHPQPGSVLILDDDLGMTRRACEEFPLHTICVVDESLGRDTATEPDTATETVPPDRVRFIVAPTEIAIRDASESSYDVAISTLVDPAQARVAARTTQSFYRAAARQLKSDGIFCQRLRLTRLEAGSLLKVLGTLSSVFEHTALIQMAPGELAILSTNSPIPLVDEGPRDRLQRPHVRRLLAQSGWDWCQVAALPVIDSADPIGLWQHESMPAPATARNGHFGLRLGWETVRPFNRAQGMAELLAPHEMRIADAVGPGESYSEFGRRISAYAQQMEVLTAFPDEPWTYRRSLKAEMLRNTRPPLQVRRQQTTEKQIHPLDQLRKDYVETLATLLKEAAAGELEPQALRELPAAAGSYEPLISDMAHYEVVRIHELSGHPFPDDEFRHRLHTVYFTPNRDLSVRNVVGALDQLIENPELLPDDAERFDRLNGLVQQLIHRWGRRTTFEPRSARRTQRDVDLSLRSVRRAMDAMEQLRAAVAMDSGDFVQRRRFVDQALIVPLREYRESVLAHRAKGEPVLTSDADEPDEDFSLEPSQWTTN